MRWAELESNQTEAHTDTAHSDAPANGEATHPESDEAGPASAHTAADMGDEPDDAAPESSGRRDVA
jgi:hypothetical protein